MPIPYGEERESVPETKGIVRAFCGGSANIIAKEKKEIHPSFKRRSFRGNNSELEGNTPEGKESVKTSEGGG